MTWSLGEVQVLTVKAARGAGYSWGLAEEAGYALRWLAARGMPGPAALAGLLGGACAAEGPCPRCPLAQGAAMADLGELPSERFALRYPLLLVPFAARLAQPVTLRWDGAAVSVSQGEVMVKGETVLAPAADCTFAPGSGIGGTPAQRVSRVPDSARAELDILTRLAARIYAPATEASRLAGAGAGTTDND